MTGPVHACRNWLPGEADAWFWTGHPAAAVAEARLPWLLTRWRVDPVLFWVEALRVIPHHYQIQILLDLADAPADVYDFYGAAPGHAKRQVLVPSGHGLGKTRVEASVIWWHQLTHAFSKRIVTAPTSDQLSTQLWGEVRKLYRRLKKYWPLLADEWEILTSSIVHRHPDYGDWYTTARTARPDKPEGLQGAHALDADDEFGDLAALFGDEEEIAPGGGICVICEEASGVPDEIRQVLEGGLSEYGARFLGCGNPTRPDGWFAEGLGQPERYAIHPLDCRMSSREDVTYIPYRDFAGDVHELRIRGFVAPAYWQTILAECDGDEDADYFRVRVRGMCPRSAVSQCISTPWVEAAEARAPHGPSDTAEIVIGLDFGVSSDKHGLAVRQGYTVREVTEWLPKDTPHEITMDAAQRAIQAQETYGHRVRYIIGDANGVGRGAMEYLHGYYAKRPQLRVTVILFNSGKGARDAKRYYRRRDEMWFARGRPFLADTRTSLPRVPGLKAQLTAPGFSDPHANRRIKVETKEEVKKRTGIASGNGADALLQTLMIDDEIAIEVTERPEREVPLAHEPPVAVHWPPALAAHLARYQRAQSEGIYIR